jgi:fatty-acyl-CoA synthase
MSELRAFELTSMEDIWQFECIPALQRYPIQNTLDLIVQAGNQFEDSLAMSFLPTGAPEDVAVEVSYRELSQRIICTANMLYELGIGPSDSVSIVLPTLPETHFALWGGSAAGISCPINPMLESEYISDILNKSNARVLITLGSGHELGIWEKIACLALDVPSLEAIVVVNVPGVTNGDLPTAPRAGIRMVDYSEAIRHQDGQAMTSGRQIASHDLAMYMHTGGTTGRPKVARLSHGNLALVASLYADLSDKWGKTASLSGLPLFHVFGIIGTGLAAFMAGRHMVLLTPSGFRNPEVVRNLWRIIERFRVPVFATVPTIISALNRIPADDCDISCLEQIATGAAPLSLGLKRIFEKQFDVQIMCGYGMTESSMILSRCASSIQPPERSVGLRVPYVDLMIGEVKGQQLQRECAAGETGVVLARGPNMFQGYLDPRDDEGTLVDGEWFNTGDAGYIDEQGYLYLTGRIKDLIIRGGHNIDPQMIEDVLCSHPEVSDAIAIGQPDPYAGEIPVVFVKLEPGKKTGPEVLLKFCLENISERAAIPKRVEFIDEVPLTAVAKVFKPELRRRAAEFAIQSTLNEAGIRARVCARQDMELGLTARVQLGEGDKADAESLLHDYPVYLEFEADDMRPFADKESVTP